MVDCARFKPEVFGSLPVAILCLMLVIVSIIFPFWLTSGGAVRPSETGTDQIGPTSPPTFISDVSFGLLYGRKSRTRGGTCTRTLRWVCSSGVCMLSCGKTGQDRKADIENILGMNNYTSSSGDEHFCPPCAENTPDELFPSESVNPFLGLMTDVSDTTVPSDATTPAGDDILGDPSKHMVRQGMIITTQVFLVVGLLFTFINIVFTVVNIAHNPVSAIVGIDGLVAWNIIAGLMYLLVLLMWGSEYNIKLRRNLGISDTLRPGTELDSHSSIGWCCLLLICPMMLHLGTGSLFAWRQWKRYYSKKSKQAREMRINVQDPTQGGTDILF
eukprot:GFUD01039646.1.p1 GENE.GFUD01039646.1~~GFUD01039646.1.p1  ORF type:complete len:329 (-),score=79.49 GFUD01039646.1:31-1017(-)